MSQGIIQRSFTMERIYPPSFSDEEQSLVSVQMVDCPGQARGVYITIHPDAVDETAEMFGRWFANQPQVSIIDVGLSDKAGLGFILMEWLECEVNPLFPEILKDMSSVADFTLYARNLMEG